METLKSLSWVVVKREALKEERITFKRIKQKETWKNKEAWKMVEVAKEIGWLPMIVDKWKMAVKKGMWRHIHRDIVSTVYKRNEPLLTLYVVTYIVSTVYLTLGNTMQHVYQKVILFIIYLFTSSCTECRPITKSNASCGVISSNLLNNFTSCIGCKVLSRISASSFNSSCVGTWSGPCSAILPSQ